MNIYDELIVIVLLGIRYIPIKDPIIRTIIEKNNFMYAVDLNRHSVSIHLFIRYSSFQREPKHLYTLQLHRLRTYAQLNNTVEPERGVHWHSLPKQTRLPLHLPVLQLLHLVIMHRINEQSLQLFYTWNWSLPAAARWYRHVYLVLPSLKALDVTLLVVPRGSYNILTNHLHSVVI